MKYEKLVIEKNEFKILKQLLNIEEKQKDTTTKSHILKLRSELKEAIFLEEEQMYNDVVRLNSLVTVSSEDGSWVNTFQLVVPSNSNIANKKISILMPMGAAVIGYAIGDIIQWEFPIGIKFLKILKVKQEIKK
ncbi:GreA/GreB family elongation factor [Tenacibaculum aestuariivivum]|uniref:GreA/GreB family elongation factor n=1 Tax=Tenacibaculum aestuariivivum TaxID=2006131 RepID=UPI003AB362F2